MKKIAFAVLLSALAAPAFAEGMYAGVNLGQSDADGFSANSFSILGGYTIDKTLAAEVAYVDLGSDSSVDVSALSVSAVGSYPINDQVSVLGRLGIASTKVEVSVPGFSGSESKTALTYGIGGQYNVSSTVGVRVGYDIYKAEGDDVSNLSIGAVMKF